MKTYTIGGIEFNEEEYQAVIKNYSEAFTHTSLSIEKEFLKLEKYEIQIKKILKEEEVNFDKLSNNDKNAIIQKYHFFVTYMGYYKGMIPKIDFENQSIIDKTYEDNFQEFDKYMTKLLVFDEEGHFSANETGKKVSIFFPNYIEEKPALEKAINSQKNHIEAFLYALNLNHINSNEIIKINEIINKSDPNMQSGFKKVNNAIIGSQIETMKKEEIPVQIAELIYKYDNNFDMTIEDPSEEDISEEERYKRLFMICLKEARFHIMFEHIHPFADGNGRTGRIIMSSNLIKQHLAPPLITSIMLEQYKNYINNYDYTGLAQMIMDSSSQTLSHWVTLKREKEGISPEDIMDKKI